jgi:chorismate dehydratase
MRMTNDVRKIRITAVSYLNTKPLLYGIFKSPVAQYIKLQLDVPSECARKLRDGEVDLGLVPVAALPELSAPRIISDYCIGTVGSVHTVCIYADRPIGKLDRLFLDHHSRTSVELTKILLREYWQASPLLIPAQDGYIDKIGGAAGGLVIGDRSIGLSDKYRYTYDLGAAWMDHTGLPFVFAAWVSNGPLPESFITKFNLALQRGVSEIPQLMYLLPAPQPNFDLQNYFTRHISYELDLGKKKALALFLKKCGATIPASLLESLAMRGEV